MRLEGIHHISAITGDAPGNVDFYTRVMGLRLVAKTVNQDDPSVYHLFYADEKGSPGAELTFFEYPGAPRGRAGSGMVHRIVSRVASTEAIGFWERRLAAEGVATERTGDVLRFADPEGLGHELVVSRCRPALWPSTPRCRRRSRSAASWGVRAYAGRADRSSALLRDVMGARRRPTARWSCAGSAAAARSRSTPRRTSDPCRAPAPCTTWRGGRRSRSTRLARAADRGGRARHAGHRPLLLPLDLLPRAERRALRDRRRRAGLHPRPAVEELGTRIILPSWLEPDRAEVEARLTPLPDPRAGWVRTPA